MQLFSVFINSKTVLFYAKFTIFPVPGVDKTA